MLRNKLLCFCITSLVSITGCTKKHGIALVGGFSDSVLSIIQQDNMPLSDDSFTAKNYTSTQLLKTIENNASCITEGKALSFGKLIKTKEAILLSINYYEIKQYLNIDDGFFKINHESMVIPYEIIDYNLTHCFEILSSEYRCKKIGLLSPVYEENFAAPERKLFISFLQDYGFMLNSICDENDVTYLNILDQEESEQVRLIKEFYNGV